MKTIFSAISAVSLVSALAASAAVAAPPTPSPSPAAKTKAAKTLTCPACKMPMPTTKSAVYSVPVKIKGVTYYCCNKCPAGKEAMMKTAPAAKPSASPKPAGK